MECQDATAHLGDYLAVLLPVEEVDALLTHAAACAACRDKLMASEPGGRSRFDAVLADYEEGPAAVRETFVACRDAPLAISSGSHVPGSAVAGSLRDKAV